MSASFLTTNLLDVIRGVSLNFDWRDALDMIIVALLFYAFLLLLKRTHSRFVLNGVAMLLAVYIAARLLNLYLTSVMLQAFFAFFAVMFAIVFQRELRSFFESLYIWGKLSGARKMEVSESFTDQIVNAVDRLAKQRIGALIVLPRAQLVDGAVQGGIMLHGRVSVPLILSIFDRSSPGHDGAAIIEGDRVKKFGVHLPLADHFENYSHLGTRHRAALGLAERTDAMVIVVSEERGTISIAEYGELRMLETSGELKDEITRLLEEKLATGKERPWHYNVTHNVREKIAALALTFFLWFVFAAQFGSGIVARQYDIPIEFRSIPSGYAVQNISAETITLTLSGRERDFDLLDQKTIRAVIAIGASTEGWHRAELDENMIRRPSSLAVVRFSPRFVVYELQGKTDTQEQ